MAIDFVDINNIPSLGNKSIFDFVIATVTIIVDMTLIIISVVEISINSYQND